MHLQHRVSIDSKLNSEDKKLPVWILKILRKYNMFALQFCFAETYLEVLEHSFSKGSTEKGQVKKWSFTLEVGGKWKTGICLIVNGWSTRYHAGCFLHRTRINSTARRYKRQCHDIQQTYIAL